MHQLPRTNLPLLLPCARAMQVDYFVAGLASSLMGVLARDFMWTRVLSSTPMHEKEVRVVGRASPGAPIFTLPDPVLQSRDRLAERVNAVRLKAEAATAAVHADFSGPASLGGFDLEAFGGGAGGIDAAVGAALGKPANDLHAAAKSM